MVPKDGHALEGAFMGKKIKAATGKNAIAAGGKDAITNPHGKTGQKNRGQSRNMKKGMGYKIANLWHGMSWIGKTAAWVLGALTTLVSADKAIQGIWNTSLIKVAYTAVEDRFFPCKAKASELASQFALLNSQAKFDYRENFESTFETVCRQVGPDCVNRFLQEPENKMIREYLSKLGRRPQCEEK
jgi:hypothetical protein